MMSLPTPWLSALPPGPRTTARIGCERRSAVTTSGPASSRSVSFRSWRRSSAQTGVKPDDAALRAGLARGPLPPAKDAGRRAPGTLGWRPRHILAAADRAAWRRLDHGRRMGGQVRVASSQAALLAALPANHP